jgi:hypothetical protein
MNATSRQTPNRSCSYRTVNRPVSVFKVAGDFLTMVLLLTVPLLAQNQNPEKICVKVDKVGKAPGIWSGIIPSTQWLDATVIGSSSNAYKVGDNLSFGLYVVHGDKFADSESPRLDSKIIYPGATLTVDTKASCRVNDGNGWISTCTRKGCSRNFRH